MVFLSRYTTAIAYHPNSVSRVTQHCSYKPLLWNGSADWIVRAHKNLICAAWQVHNEQGSKRVVVTKPLPGDRWLQILTAAGCRVEISQHEDTILSIPLVKQLIGNRCDGVIGQLTEVGDSPPS